MPQRLESFTACDIGTQMVSCYLPPATAFQGTQTAEREDFDLNNTAYDTNIPEEIKNNIENLTPEQLQVMDL